MGAKKKPVKTLPRAVAKARLAKKPRTTRRALGARSDGEAIFPVPPPKSELPSGYDGALVELKELIQETRLRTVLSANAAMIDLYWGVGRVILARQAKEGWGAKVIDRLSTDLRAAFPDMSGLSARNLKYMRAFAAAWPDEAIVQARLHNLTWYHHLALLEKLDTSETRLWYAGECARHGWSRSILEMHIERRLHERQGKAVTNFKKALPPGDSDKWAPAESACLAIFRLRKVLPLRSFTPSKPAGPLPQGTLSLGGCFFLYTRAEVCS